MLSFKGTIPREDLSLNWQTHGCFSFTWAQDMVAQIQHTPGAIADNLPVNISPAWKLDNNYHEFLAGVSLGITSPRLREFFPDSSSEIFATYAQEHLNELATANFPHSAQAAIKERAQNRRPPPAAEKLGVPLTIPSQVG